MSKLNEFIELTIPGSDSLTGMREKIKIHYSQIAFQNQDGCFVNYLGKWVIPCEMNNEIENKIQEIDQ